MKEAGYKRGHAILIHLYDVQEEIKLILRGQNISDLCGEQDEDGIHREEVSHLPHLVVVTWGRWGGTKMCALCQFILYSIITTLIMNSIVSLV